MYGRYNLSSLSQALRKRIRKFRGDPTSYINNKANHFENCVENKSCIYFSKILDLNLEKFQLSYLIESHFRQLEIANILWSVIPNNFYVMHPSATLEI